MPSSCQHYGYEKLACGLFKDLSGPIAMATICPGFSKNLNFKYSVQLSPENTQNVPEILTVHKPKDHLLHPGTVQKSFKSEFISEVGEINTIIVSRAYSLYCERNQSGLESQTGLGHISSFPCSSICLSSLLENSTLPREAGQELSGSWSSVSIDLSDTYPWDTDTWRLQQGRRGLSENSNIKSSSSPSSPCSEFPGGLCRRSQANPSFSSVR